MLMIQNPPRNRNRAPRPGQHVPSTRLRLQKLSRDFRLITALSQLITSPSEPSGISCCWFQCPLTLHTRCLMASSHWPTRPVLFLGLSPSVGSSTAGAQ